MGVLEGGHVGHGAGGQSQRPAPPAATVHAGFASAFPARGPLYGGVRSAEAQDFEITLLLLLPMEGHPF